jgi:hypothetical protein
MEVIKSSQEVAVLISEALRIELQEKEEFYEFNFSCRGLDKVIQLDKQELDELVVGLGKKSFHEETVIFDDYTYEVLLREESVFPKLGFRLRDKSIVVDDKDNDLMYRLSRPTNEFLIYLLLKVSEITSPSAMLMQNNMTRLFERQKEGDELDIFELIKTAIPRFITLHITSGKNRRSSELERYSNAFLFQLSYNIDSALVPQRHIEEIVRTSRINRIRRSSLDELDPPRRHYIPDLIHHYQLAVGSDNPFLEFISYYHVAEHFFETVFNQDLVDRISKKITQPDFSYKRKTDIGSLLTDIKKSLQIKNDSIAFSELEALKLVLLNYIDFDDLKDKINSYDPTLSEYYRTTKVQFSNGDPFDISSEDKTNLIKKVAARIYKTRNAIVHSKDSNRSKYMPFRDDKVLVKEVPLLRFIAEQVIIGSSNIVG